MSFSAFQCKKAANLLNHQTLHPIATASQVHCIYLNLTRFLLEYWLTYNATTAHEQKQLLVEV
jgi:hypothetical protein